MTEQPPHAETTSAQRRLTPGTLVLIAGVIAVILVFAVQLARRQEVRPDIGALAPAFEMTDFEGQPLNLADLRGQIVVINFWGSWCPPCRAEAPDLQAIYEDYAERGVILAGVNWLDTERQALAFIAEFDLTYPNAPDIGERVARAYRIQSAPETFVVGPDGRVLEIFIGPVTYNRLAASLERILADGQSG